MHPVLVKIGPVTLYTYGLMVALALLSAFAVLHIGLRRQGKDPSVAFDAILGAAIGGIAGARLFYVLQHWSQFSTEPVQIVKLTLGGLVWYGGFIGATAVGLLIIWSRRSLNGRFLDLGAFGVALGYAVGRLGCFLNGDDYGVPSSLPWAMSFPKGTPPTTIRVHPTQLYETGGALLILGILWLVHRRGYLNGQLFLLAILLMSVERFAVEFIRTNPAVAAGLTLSQFVAIGLFVVSVAGLLVFSRWKVLAPAVEKAAEDAMASAEHPASGNAEATS